MISGRDKILSLLAQKSRFVGETEYLATRQEIKICWRTQNIKVYSHRNHDFWARQNIKSTRTEIMISGRDKISSLLAQKSRFVGETKYLATRQEIMVCWRDKILSQ